MISLVLLFVIVAILAVNHRAVYMVVKNATLAKLPDPVLDGWEGGETYLHVPYAAESDAEYLNLYVPSGVENPTLFVSL